MFKGILKTLLTVALKSALPSVVDELARNIKLWVSNLGNTPAEYREDSDEESVR